MQILHDSKLLLGLSKFNFSALCISRTETSAVVFREQNSVCGSDVWQNRFMLIYWHNWYLCCCIYWTTSTVVFRQQNYAVVLIAWYHRFLLFILTYLRFMRCTYRTSTSAVVPYSVSKILQWYSLLDRTDFCWYVDITQIHAVVFAELLLLY